MKTASLVLCTVALAVRAFAATGFQAEAGVSYFVLDDTRLEPSGNIVSVDEPREAAPFVAAGYGFNERFGLRVSYQFINDARTTTQFASTPPIPPSLEPVIVFGHYDDDVHVFSLAPELKAALSPRLTLAVASQLNWVASRGVVSYASDHPLIQLVAPRERREDGFTLGGAVRLHGSLGNRAAVSVGYQHIDLDPSFDRRAHVFSGGVSWRF